MKAPELTLALALPLAAACDDADWSERQAFTKDVLCNVNPIDAVQDLLDDYLDVDYDPEKSTSYHPYVEAVTANPDAEIFMYLTINPEHVSCDFDESLRDEFPDVYVDFAEMLCSDQLEYGIYTWYPSGDASLNVAYVDENTEKGYADQYELDVENGYVCEDGTVVSSLLYDKILTVFQCDFSVRYDLDGMPISRLQGPCEGNIYIGCTYDQDTPLEDYPSVCTSIASFSSDLLNWRVSE